MAPLLPITSSPSVAGTLRDQTPQPSTAGNAAASAPPVVLAPVASQEEIEQALRALLLGAVHVRPHTCENVSMLRVPAHW